MGLSSLLARPGPPGCRGQDNWAIRHAALHRDSGVCFLPVPDVGEATVPERSAVGTPPQVRLPERFSSNAGRSGRRCNAPRRRQNRFFSGLRSCRLLEFSLTQTACRAPPCVTAPRRDRSRGLVQQTCARARRSADETAATAGYQVGSPAHQSPPPAFRAMASRDHPAPVSQWSGCGRDETVGISAKIVASSPQYLPPVNTTSGYFARSILQVRPRPGHHLGPRLTSFWRKAFESLYGSPGMTFRKTSGLSDPDPRHRCQRSGWEELDIHAPRPGRQYHLRIAPASPGSAAWSATTPSAARS